MGNPSCWFSAKGAAVVTYPAPDALRALERCVTA